jgi:hypothetical protein
MVPAADGGVGRFNGPNKAGLKCGPLDPGMMAGFIIRQVSQVTTMIYDKNAGQPRHNS